MTDIFNSQFNDYVHFIATDASNGQVVFRPSVVTVNLSGLADNKAQYQAAVMALSQWSQLTGISFVNAAQAQIEFRNDSADRAETITYETYSIVEVSKNWMSAWRPSERWGIGSYGFTTFMHEIGHALGLSHGGHYNGSAIYDTDRMFDIDTWQYSLMSYFDQTKYAPNHASYIFPASPMLADIEAIKLIFGNLAVNTGDTVYGSGSKIMNGVTDIAKLGKTAFAIHDTGGYDTINLTKAKAGSMIDLQPGHFSNLNGYVGNMGIASDTIIEQVNGSKFADVIIGNAAANALLGMDGNDTIDGGAGNDAINGGNGNDTLTGGSGADVFIFNGKLSASKNVDVITDFNPADDVIYLENAIFKALKATGELAESMFTSNTSGVALDSSDRVIYNSATGDLLYDADGAGRKGAILVAKLGAGLDVTYHDFIVI